MNKANKLIVAAAAAFFGISSLGVGVGFAAWTYVSGDTSANANVNAAAGTNWTYSTGNSMFYRMIDDYTVDWNSSITPALFDHVESVQGSVTYSRVKTVHNPADTNICAYYPAYLYPAGSPTAVQITGADPILDGYYVTPFENEGKVKQIYLPTSYSSIGEAAFSSSTALKVVNFYDATSLGYSPSSSFTLGYSAFWDCTSLEVINLPANTSAIQGFAFGSYDSLPSLTINYAGSAYQWMKNVTRDDYWALYDYPSVYSSDATFTYPSGAGDTHTVAFNSSATSVAANTFENDTNLTSVSLGSGVNSIGASAFFNCSGFTSLEIPNNVASISANAFGADNSIGALSITYPGSVYSWMNNVLKDVTWHLGRAVTVSCTDATVSYPATGTSTSDPHSVVCKNSATTVEESAFANDTDLTAATLGSGVTSIEASAFYNTSALATLSIPSNVTSIGADAFGADNSAGLLTITYNGSVYSWMHNVSKDIAWHLGRAVTVNCTDATVSYPATGTSTSDPHSVAYKSGATSSVQASTFENDGDLTSIAFVPGITTIESKAFYGCTKLTSLAFTSGLTSIETEAFRGCTGLTSVTLKDVSQGCSIRQQAFFDCTALTSVKIPTKVTTMGSKAFGVTSSVATDLRIYYTGNNLSWSNLIRNKNYVSGRTGTLVHVYKNSII